MASGGTDRREIPQRQTRWAGRAAEVLYRLKVRPNHISVVSVAFALVGTVALVLSPVAAQSARPWYFAVVVVCIPLRLLCNMLDGMLAVEKGLHSPTGDLYNEVPDRIADLALIAGAGYATGAYLVSEAGTNVGVLIGWVAATAAVGTAYVRTLGAAQGVGNFFDGPTAKPARMWILVLASVASMLEPLAQRGVSMLIAVAVIAIGSIVTIIRRLARITRALRERGSAGTDGGGS